jgi:GNAT superfamily N-acetyltransferase
MVQWIDGEGREIEIEVVGDGAQASHEGERVGRVETTGQLEIDDWHWSAPEITGMFVDEEYQRAGMGLRLIEELYRHYGEQLVPAAKNIGIGGLNALTDDGLALTRRAQAAGFVAPFPDDVEGRDDD